MKKLLFVLAAMLMASSAFAGHWVTFEADEFEYTSGAFFVEKDGVTIQGYGRIDYDHFRFYANNSVTVSHDDGIMAIEFTCLGEDDGEYGPGGFEKANEGQRGYYSYEGHIGLWEDGIFTQGEFTPFEEETSYDVEEGGINPMTIVEFNTTRQVRCNMIKVYVLSEGTPNPPVVDQVGAPTFEGYSVDGITGYGVYILPTTEGSEIMYRVSIWDEENNEWALVTDWTLYEGTEGEIYMTEMNAKYRVDAYAFIGQVQSPEVAYEFVVTPPTGINEMNAGKTVAGVRYFNMAGQEMQQADGLTIVVTTYTDGTTSAAKVVK